MARNKNENTPEGIVVTDANTPGLPAMAEAANLLSARSSAIAKQFDDGLPYDRSRVVTEARFYMAQSAEAMLEAGKRLIVLKENEAHGDFENIIQEKLGLPERTAQRMMAASIKYLSPTLLTKAPTLALLGKSKLFELMTEDDEELAGLANGGTVAGITLDEVDRMSCRELRGALRDARENAAAQARILADKNDKLDDLATKLSTRQSRVRIPPPDVEGEEIRQEAGAFAFEAEAVLRGKLRAAFQSLAEHTEKHGHLHDDFMAGLLGQLELSVAQLREEFDVKAAPDGQSMPDWLRDDAAQPAQG